MRLAFLFVPLVCLTAAPAFGQGAEQQPFRVFFDWGKPELSREAQATLDEVLAAYRQLNPARIVIAGHTDRSGSAAFNRITSGRRANTVKAHLVTQGIPAGMISVVAYGESRPIVPTEDGVREAQNRRVEISFAKTSPKVTRAEIRRTDGSAAGTVSLVGNNVTLVAENLSAGAHGLHLHAVGRCDGPDFASAGPHWNPTSRKHGSENPEGPHLGDLPNLQVGADGRGVATLALPPGFLDEDGAALIIHAAPDDNRTDPSGNSGARIACAVLRR